MADFPIRVAFTRDGSLDRALDELEAELENVVRGMTVELWNQVLNRTPQYLGRMAASWSYSLDYPVFWDRSAYVESAEEINEAMAEGDYKFVKENFAKRRGHSAAVGIANAYTNGVDRRFKLGDTVYFANGVDHGEGAYSGLVEQPGFHLRPANRPGMPLAKTLDYAQIRYGENISFAAAQRLKGYSLGVS